MNSFLKVFPLLLVVALAGCRPTEKVEPSPSTPHLDPRLDGFLTYAIKDKAALGKEKRVYAAQNVSFEGFIYLVFSGSNQGRYHAGQVDGSGSTLGVPREEPPAAGVRVRGGAEEIPGGGVQPHPYARDVSADASRPRAALELRALIESAGLIP